jgi:ribonucleoside-diphosphate reductase alpha chain
MKSNLLPTDYQNFIALSRYARWLDDEQRRETWTETVSRYFDYMQGLHGNIITKSLRKKLEDKILGLDVMPSMRALMTAGPALKTCNVTSYNCSYIPVDSVRAFDECMYILMCGTGVGFSVERSNVDKLPIVNEHFEDSSTVIKVADSRSGWAKALRELLAMLYVGQIPTLDVSEVRPAGAKLKTMGGRASGPAPLIDLYNFCVGIFKGAKGRRLYPIECHDLMCKIGEVVVVGGVRRSALISLSNLGDDQMRHAKSGKWWDNEGQRSLANNSVAYKTKPDMGTFMREWLALYESHSGERGIFNRQAAINKVKENGRRKASEKENPVEPEDYIQFGCNPCSEIILRPYQFCNLTEVVCRATDTIETLKEKVEVATILGTLQSTLTDFKYLRKVWKQNTEEERLLGVSLTGILDCPILAPNSVALESTLVKLREVAVQTNKKYAKMLDIPQSTAITCVKPSGTVSQLVDSASGIHARHSEYYIRTVRGGNTDPLTQFMKDVGIPAEPDLGKPNTTTVFSFPTKSPHGAVTRTEMTAIDQLEYWLVFQRHWCEHKPSVTISVKEHEWMEVGAWVYKNFDEVSGISFLPFSEHTYQQAPYQDINEEQYKSFLEKMPSHINWSLLKEYEKEDTTIGSKEFACTADSCEIVDIQ